MLKEELGDTEAQAAKTKIRGLIVAKTTLDPFTVIEKFHSITERTPIRVPLCSKNSADRKGCPNRFGGN